MKNNLYRTIVVLSLILLSACAPKVAPAPSTPAPAATTSPPTSNIQSPAFQDAAWTKIVEAAKKEGTLTVYSYSWVGDAGTALTKAFSEKYGIKLEIITGRGSEFLERMKTEQRMGQVSGDVMEGATTHLGNAKAANLLVAVAQDLPVVKEPIDVWNIEPLFVDKEGFIFPVIPVPGPPFINTKLIRPEDEPKSWAELLEPKWKGKFMLQDPVVSTGAYRMLGYIRHNIFNEDFLRRFGDHDPLYTTGIQQEVQFLARGERPLSLVTVTSDAASTIEAGAPIKALSMKEGIIAWEIVAGVVKNSQHPNAAKVFMNWIMSKDGQLVNAQAKRISAIRKDVADFTPPAAQVKTKLLTLTPEMLDEQTKMFGEKYLVKLWKK